MHVSTAIAVPPATAAALDPAHSAALRRIARRLLGCDHLADDAVQEALLALCQQPVAPPSPRAWLIRAVVHRSRHLRRTLRRRRRHEDLAAEHCHLHGDCDNPLHIAIAHELGARRAAARAALPPAQRDVLACYEDLGLDYAAIAARLCVPIGTVRSRLARARAAVAAAAGGLLAAPGSDSMAAGSGRRTMAGERSAES